MAFLSDAVAADITVLSSVEFQPAVRALILPFEQSTGQKIRLNFSPENLIERRVAAQESFDVAIIGSRLAAELQRKDNVFIGELLSIGNARIGVAVRHGAAAPDISTAALWHSLARAKSIAYAPQEESGSHFISMIGRYGLTLEPKCLGVYDPLSLVAQGDAELGIQLDIQIQAADGIKFVGLLPFPFQSEITMMTAANKRSQLTGSARDFIAFLGSAAATRIVHARPPSR